MANYLTVEGRKKRGIKGPQGSHLRGLDPNCWKKGERFEEGFRCRLQGIGIDCRSISNHSTTILLTPKVQSEENCKHPAESAPFKPRLYLQISRPGEADDVFTTMAVFEELSDYDSLVKSISTSSNSEDGCQHLTFLAPLVIKLVLSADDPAKPDMADLCDVQIVKKLSDTVDATEKQSLVVNAYAATEEGKSHILYVSKKFKVMGCNGLLIHKEILRDVAPDSASTLPCQRRAFPPGGAALQKLTKPMGKNPFW
ncbi:hypothetical protein VNO77_08128 [Canavalia gladiata]|uniref:Uncharacterized protein n=1 Tax=Canavalia gladiata TaxID=3824 RepID=A0AAN9QW37_CANGL